VKIAVTDRNGSVRAAATWALSTLQNPPGAVAEYITFLRAEASREPALLSLQATGLVRPPQPSEAADRQLIDTLIGILILQDTRYVPYRVWQGYDTGWIPHFLGNGKHRHAHYSSKRMWAKFDVPVPCDLARQLLVAYTGQDFGYDRQAWRNWQVGRSSATNAPSPGEAKK
jgi:hypothetical protein